VSVAVVVESGATVVVSGATVSTLVESTVSAGFSVFEQAASTITRLKAAKIDLVAFFMVFCFKISLHTGNLKRSPTTKGIFLWVTFA
jgi:hypothetical protein